MNEKTRLLVVVGLTGLMVFAALFAFSVMVN
jgi:hypothetical protein